MGCLALCASKEDTFDYDNNEVSVGLMHGPVSPAAMNLLYLGTEPGQVLLVMDPSIQLGRVGQKGPILRMILRLPSEPWVVCEVNCKRRVVQMRVTDVRHMPRIHQSNLPDSVNQIYVSPSLGLPIAISTKNKLK